VAVLVEITTLKFDLMIGLKEIESIAVLLLEINLNQAS
jgi:hypothetical protein